MTFNPFDTSLDDALAAATAQVKARPADLAARRALVELLLFAGNLDRSDRLLEAFATLAPAEAEGARLLRRLIQAESRRRAVFGLDPAAQPHAPEPIGPATPALHLRIRAVECWRQGRFGQTVALLDEADSLAAPLAGQCDGEDFHGLRDLDDLTAGILEFLTGDGRYCWIGLDQIITLTFPPPERLRDLLWRPAHLVGHGCVEGDIHVPALYAGSHAAVDGALRLGRQTAWRETGDVVHGVGQRCLLTGETDRPLLSIGQLTLHA